MQFLFRNGIIGKMYFSDSIIKKEKIMEDFYNMPNVTIFTHPLIQHKISLMRDKNTGTNEFRKLAEEVATL